MDYECHLNWSVLIDNVAYHEMGHLFTIKEDHWEGLIGDRIDPNDWSTVMALENKAGCGTDPVETSERRDTNSGCTVNTIQSHIGQF